jgi:septal ring factor EnvC (AmiA/AmiB activator)
MMLINLQHNPHLLEADLQNVRQMDWRVQEDLRRVQTENARLQAENARLRIERDRARDSLARVLQLFESRHGPLFPPRN